MPRRHWRAPRRRPSTHPCPRRRLAAIAAELLRRTYWTASEANTGRLWDRLRRLLGRFLTGQWRSGALAGARPGQAFFVTVGRTTMTQDDIDGGRLVIEVGVAPLRPAEFVVLRIFQKTQPAERCRRR